MISKTRKKNYFTKSGHPFPWLWTVFLQAVQLVTAPSPMFSFAERVKLLPTWKHVIGWIANIFGGAKSQPYTGFTRTLTPTNFWILSGSHMSTKLAYHCPGGVRTYGRPKLGSETQKIWKLSSFTLCYSEISEELIPRLVNQLKGWNFSSFHQTHHLSLCLSRSGWCTECGSWHISLIVNLLAFEITDAFRDHLYPQACFPEETQKYLNVIFVMAHLEN